MSETDEQTEAPKVRRSAWQSARESAIECAGRNALSECPYRNEAWRSFWFREFEKAQQLPLALNWGG